MSSKNEAGEKPKKGKGLLIKLLLGLTLIGAGGGGAYALVATGMIGDGAPQDNNPKLVRKGEKDPYPAPAVKGRSEEHTSELQSRENLVCRLLLEKKKTRSAVTA